MGHDYRVLDLFSGLGGFSQAFKESDRWDVTTVEIDPEFDPDVVADVFDLLPSDFDDFDVALASPPCEEFSPANNLNGDRDPDGDAVALVYHALGLIRGIDPQYWFVENPRGRLRSYIGRPSQTVTYCQYGEDRMKPTDLWGEHPPTFVGRRCAYGDDCHTNTRNGTTEQQAAGYDTAARRAKVPDELSRAIRDACEAALDGDGQEQAALDDW